MDDGLGGRKGSSRAEELILRTVAAHADSLLRTARRHSICVDDAQDAYQRSLEIFMRNADRLDPARAAAWLHVVVKREAQSIRRARNKQVNSVDVNLDEQEARSIPTPDEHLMTFDLIRRSAEALQRLKPQELRALWLKAQGTLPKLWPGCFRPVFWAFWLWPGIPYCPWPGFEGAVPASRNLFNRATLSKSLRRGTFFNPGIFRGG